MFSFLHTIAAFDFELLIPLFAIMMVFGIPIVAILTAHQRKMAELIHSKGQTQNEIAPLVHEVERMKTELAYLRQKVNEQSIQLDDLQPLGRMSSTTVSDTPPDVPDRLRQQP